jgi:hypothetical protein
MGWVLVRILLCCQIHYSLFGHYLNSVESTCFSSPFQHLCKKLFKSDLFVKSHISTVTVLVQKLKQEVSQ